MELPKGWKAGDIHTVMESRSVKDAASDIVTFLTPLTHVDTVCALFRALDVSMQCTYMELIKDGGSEAVLESERRLFVFLAEVLVDRIKAHDLSRLAVLLQSAYTTAKET